MPYEIRHNIEGCSGYAVVLKDSGKIVTCHPDKTSALKHLAALEINVEEAKMDKSEGKRVGQFVSWGSSGGTAHGKIIRIIRDGRVKVPGSSFEIIGTPENPAALIRVYEKKDGKWKPTERIVGHKVASLKTSSETTKMEKAEGHTPNDGMISAAKRALKWKEDGHAGGTSIGLGRAHQIVNRESLSDSTVKRMYSFFSRHEVDKKATGFSSGEEGFPSPGRVAWDLWGGDSGYSWSRDKVAGMEKLFMHGGSTEFKVEYNVGDCQGGWAVLKDGTGQVVGCYKTENEAIDHMEELTTEMTDILGDEVRTSKSPNEYSEKAYGATSFWDGVFFPAQKGVMGIDNDTNKENARFVSTYNTPPQKDGTESTGYGNSSGGTNPR